MKPADLSRKSCPKEGIDITGVPFNRISKRYEAYIDPGDPVSLEVAFMAKDPEVTKPDYCVAYSLVYKGRTPGGSLSIEKMKVFALLDYYQARESNSVVNQDSIEGKVEIDKDDLGLASKLVEMHRLDTISIRASYRTKDYDKQENELCRKLAEYVLHQLEMIDILNHPELSTF